MALRMTVEKVCFDVPAARRGTLKADRHGLLSLSEPITYICFGRSDAAVERVCEKRGEMVKGLHDLCGKGRGNGVGGPKPESHTAALRPHDDKI
jgi:hypothetical protein